MSADGSAEFAGRAIKAAMTGGMSGDVGAEVAAVARELQIRAAGLTADERVVLEAARWVADVEARADKRVEAAKAEAVALRERVEDALSLAEQRQHPMDPRAATVYVADVRAALDPESTP